MRGLRDTVYRHRFMGSLICVLILLILFVNWKYAPRDQTRSGEIRFRDVGEAALELPPTTTHRTVAASPPRPETPVPQPEDVVIDDPVELPDAELIPGESLDVEARSSPAGEGRLPVSDPEQPARMTHIVEPSRSDIPELLRGEVVVYVRLLLDSNGDVVTTELESIRNREGNRMDVPTGEWTEQVLEAASKWRFRPAMDRGETVWSETVIQFYL